MAKHLDNKKVKNGGGKRIWTDDPLLAKQMLYQLSYAPMGKLRNS